MTILLAAIVLVIVILALGGWITQNVAMNNQAVATIEVAKLARAESTANNVLMFVIILMGAFILFALLAILYLYVKLRGQSGAGKWAPGPNANFGRIGAGNQTPDLNTLIALMLMQQMNGRNALPGPGANLPVIQERQFESLDDWGWNR